MDIAWGQVFVVSAPIAGTLGGAVLAYFGTRRQAEVNAQTVVNEGFKNLVKDLKEERDQLRVHVERLDRRIEHLVQHVSSLERQLWQLGAQPPAPPSDEP